MKTDPAVLDFFHASENYSAQYRLTFAKAHQQTVEALNLERENLLASMQWCLASDQVDLGFDYAVTLHQFMDLSGDWMRWKAFLERLLAITDHDNLAQRARLSYQLGALHNLIGNPVQAETLLKQAVDYCEDVFYDYSGLDNQTILTLFLLACERLASLYFGQAKYTELEAIYAKAMRRATPEDYLEACLVVTHFANSQFVQGEQEKALQLHQANLTLQEHHQHQRGQADTIYWMAMISMMLRQYDNAFKFHNQSLAIRKKIGDKRGIVVSLIELAETHSNHAEYDVALPLVIESNKIAKQIGYKRGIITTTKVIAKLQQATGHNDAARTKYFECLKLYKELGDQRSSADVWQAIARLEISESNFNAAYKACFEALKIAKHLHHHLSDQIYIYGMLGLIAGCQSDARKARKYFTTCLDLLAQIKNPSDKARALRRAVDYILTQDSSPYTLEFLPKAKQILIESGFKESGVLIQTYLAAADTPNK